MDDVTEKKTGEGSWYELQELTRLLPSSVPAIRDAEGKLLPSSAQQKILTITTAARLLLWQIRDHADIRTNEARLKRETMAHETQLNLRTVDRALAVLSEADIISSRQMYNPDGTWSVAVRRINRDRLRALAGRRVEDAGLRAAIDDVSVTGEGMISVPGPRIEQAKTALFGLAGSLRIRIDEEPGGAGFCILRVRRNDSFVAEPVTGSDQKVIDARVESVVTPSGIRRTNVPDAPQPVVDALLGLSYVGPLLISTAERLAKTLVDDYGESDALHYIGVLSPKVLLKAANPDTKNPAGYLRACIDREYAIDVEKNEWPLILGAIEEGLPGVTVSRAVEDRTLTKLRSVLVTLAGDQYVIGEYRDGCPDWAEETTARGWLPITKK